MTARDVGGLLFAVRLYIDDSQIMDIYEGGAKV